MPWNRVLRKFDQGTLRSGGNGKRVRSRAQALAIMLSEKSKADEGDPEYQAEGNMKTHTVKLGKKHESFPVKEGSLHRMLGIPQGETIGQERLKKASHSSNATIRRKAISGIGLTHMHHGA